MLFNTQVQNPASLQITDNGQPIAVGGRNGDLLVGEIGGKYRAAALRGNVFYMATLIAGVALPVNATNLVSKFTLINPSGSAKVVELIELTIGIDSATEVVNGISLGYQTAPVALTSTTAIQNGPASTLLGSGLTSVCSGYAAGTLTNAAVLPEYPLGLNFDATAAGRSGNFVYNFDGKFILPANTLITIMTTVVAETATPCGLTWAEWLL